MKDLITIHKEEGLETKELSGLYLIRNLDTNALKIGITNNLQSRFEGLIATFKHVGINPRLRVECFLECETDIYSKLERMLHKKFKKCNVQNEWFNIKDINVILDFVSTLNEDDFKDKGYVVFKELRLTNGVGNVVSIPMSILSHERWGEMVGIICYIYSMTNRRGYSMFALSELIKYMGFNPRTGKGRTNERIRNALKYLMELSYLEDMDNTILNCNKQTNFIKCKLIPRNENSFNLKVEDIDKITTVICKDCGIKFNKLLIVYCYLLINMNEQRCISRKEMFYAENSKMLPSEAVTHVALKMLQELNLIELIN